MNANSISKVQIRHAALSNTVVIARFGKDPTLALDTRNAMDDFWKALVSYSFDGKLPEKGQSAEVTFGGGDEQFVMTLRRVSADGLGGESKSSLIEEIESLFPGKDWLFAKGKLSPQEPMFGFQVFNPGDPYTAIAEGESDDPIAAVKNAATAKAEGRS